jgi:hypothetical protein
MKVGGQGLSIALLFVAITTAMTYPLIRVAGGAFPQDAGDPSLNTWLLWWSSRAVPLTDRWWNAPMFYPMSDAMALSELLIGLLPITVPVQSLTGNPLLAYNVAFLSSFVLCGLAAYALARNLTGRRDAALAAGLVFAFGPYRMGQLSHIQMLAYYWAPVALLGLHRYLTAHDVRRRIAWLCVFGGAWLMQAFSNGYALFHLTVLVAIWTIWFTRDVRRGAPIAIALALAALPLVPAAVKYRSVHDRLHLERDINEIRRLSADVTSIASAPPSLAVWGGRLMPGQAETAMFPGATVLLVCAVGASLAFRRRRTEQARRRRVRSVAGVIAVVFAAVAASTVVIGPWSIGSVTVTEFHKPFSLAMVAGFIWLAGSATALRAWRERSVPVFYAIAAVTMLLLSLGPEPTFAGRPILYEAPYAWLMRLPGFDVLRVPARFAMLALLCQAMVVGFVIARWVGEEWSWRPPVLALIAAGLVADGWIRLPLIPAPSPGPSVDWHRAGVRAVVELPAGEPIVDFAALYRSMSHERPVVNGFSGFAPPHYLPFVYAIGQRQSTALSELAASGPIAVAIDRSLHWHTDMERMFATLPRARPLAADARWATFIVSPVPSASISLGARLMPVSVRANRQPQDVARLADADVGTAWGSGAAQTGSEELIVEFDREQPFGAVVLKMAAYSFGFPRDLAIDFSRDGSNWQTAWRSETSVATVRAAVRDPSTVPVTFDLGGPEGRFIRLRQLGSDPSIPWWIAELEFYGK